MDLLKSIKSFKYAINGIRWLILHENNFKIHLLATTIVVGFGWYFRISYIDWIIIALCISGVMAAEAFNTAIEQLVDHYSTEHHPRLGLIKDISAAAVLFVSLAAAIGGIIVFSRYLI